MILVPTGRKHGLRWWWGLVRVSICLGIWPKRLCTVTCSGMGTFYSFYVRHQWIQIRVVDHREPLSLMPDECTKLLRLIRHSERRLNFTTPEPVEAEVKRNPSIFDAI